MFLLLYFLSGVFFMPLWRFISKKYGKYQGWFFAMLIASSSFIWAFFLEAGDILQYILICTASGAALGADLLFPPAILADNLYISQAESNASVYYSALTLTAKAALAIVSGFALITLESVGFTPDAKNSQGAVIGLKVAYALIPCALKCIAALMLWLMFINSKKERL
jgi:Na+/melibiose symporter-like transporter